MARVSGAVLSGVHGAVVEVEVRISSLLPRIDLVGLPEAAVRESAARVRAAIAASGFAFPERRITVNLAPAALRKSGASLDLPIAVGILAAAGALARERLDGLGFAAELALDGRLRPVRGALGLALALRDAGCQQIVVAAGNAAEAALAPRTEVVPAPDLAAVARFVRGTARLDPAQPSPFAPDEHGADDLDDVRGHARAKRALEIAATGGHGLLLLGPPGSGKTMLARRLPGLLPPLDFSEALEITQVHSAAGRLPEGVAVIGRRPFRAPHHAATRAGVLGGGAPLRPGEVSLAHRGVLFLDEFPEFERSVREALRQVLEERCVTLTRAAGTAVFPADFQLVAAANPCPCGWWGSRWRPCRCGPATLQSYSARLSGPLLDRIDLFLQLPALSWRELDTATPPVPPAAEIRRQVAAARGRAAHRLAPLGIRRNAEIGDRDLESGIAASPEARALLGRAVDRMRLSARGARRVLRVARSIADLGGEARVEPGAIAEALSFRGEAADPEGAAPDPREGAARGVRSPGY